MHSSLIDRLYPVVCVFEATKTIHDAVRANSIKELELIVGHGGNVNEVDAHSDDKFTALHWAAHAGSLEVCTRRPSVTLQPVRSAFPVHALASLAKREHRSANAQGLDTGTHRRHSWSRFLRTGVDQQQRQSQRSRPSQSDVPSHGVCTRQFLRRTHAPARRSGKPLSLGS